MLEELTTAAHEVVAKVRSRKVIDDAAGVRTDGPDAADADPHFICGLMAPEFGAPVFADYLGSASIARYVRPFIGEELRLGWVHLCAVRDDYESRLAPRYRRQRTRWQLRGRNGNSQTPPASTSSNGIWP